jgi:ATP-dependent Clp protease, protease subunit
VLAKLRYWLNKIMSVPPIQPPLLIQAKPPAFVSFTAEIVPNTTETLLATFANLVNQGFQEIHLLLSTPGGSVSHGIAIYNTLRGLPLKTLVTHNVGNVESIGAVVFLAGTRRYACAQSRFMLHGVSFGVPTPTNFFERNLVERLEALKADQQRIKAIYQERAGIAPEVAEQFFMQETTVNASDGITHGIVHELREVQIPNGSPVFQLVFNRQ